MIPSLLQIPSAVSDSKLHSVLPNNGKGDFTFDRSTGATRINKDGLIEEVGYFSSELVQNGNFSELGSELVTNGDFATNSDWTLGTGWSINNGKLVGSLANNTNAHQLEVFSTGKTYKIVFTVSDYEQGVVRLQFAGGGATTGGTNVSANGTYTQYLTATHNHTSFRFKGLSTDGGFTGKIDNVSVKQVDPNDRWTLGTGWGLTTSANWDTSLTSGNTALEQNYSFEAGKNYRLKFDISNNTTGRLFIRLEGASFQSLNSTYTEYADGSYIINFNSTHNNTVIKFWGNGTYGSFSIDNISLVEVQGDRPRLSYDITNGVVEDTPHLLLEPSSTNLVTFSEDFSQSYWTKSDTTINVNQSTSPDGNINADSIVSSTANSVHYLRHTFVAVSALTPHTYSFFIKPNGYTKFGVRDNAQTGANLTYDLQTESVIYSASMTIVVNKLKDNWFRCSLTSTIGSNGVAGYALYLLDDGYGTPPNAGDPNNYNYTGDGVSGFYIYGFQLEQQSYATSYIPTAGTTITRAAETCNNSKPSVNSTEGVLYAEIQALANDGTTKRISINDDTDENVIQIYYSSTVNRTVGRVAVGDTTQASLVYDSATVTEFNKIAINYKENDFALWINGIKVASDTSGSTFSANTLSKLSFNRGDGGNPFYGKVKGLAVYNEALSESQLMQLTGVTASSIYNNFVTRTASFTVEALNEVKKVIDNL